jgi:hypothetical protein
MIVMRETRMTVMREARMTVMGETVDSGKWKVDNASILSTLH